MTISKKQLDEAERAAWARGHAEGMRYGVDVEAKRLQSEFAGAKLQQMQAAHKILEEAGRMMSRAGYMIGKINGDTSR